MMENSSLHPKKIAVLHPQAHISGGAVRMMLSAANVLQEDALVVFCSFTSSDTCFPELQSSLMKKIFRGPLAGLRLAFFLRKFDVIICGNSPMHLYAVMSRLFFGRASILWWHHHIPWHAPESDVSVPEHPLKKAFFLLKGWVEKNILSPQIDEHIATSATVSDALSHYLGVSCTIIYPVVDPIFSTAREQKTDTTKRIITHGRLVAGKGVGELLGMFELLQKDIPNVEFWIIGAGPLLDELSEKYSDPSIRFFGEQDAAQIVSLYAQCDVAVFASTIDAFGMSVLESIMMQIDTFCLSTNASHEVIGNAHNGRLFEDLDSMGQALVSVLGKDSKKDNKNESTQPSVQNRYGLSSLSGDLMNLINKNTK